MEVLLLLSWQGHKNKSREFAKAGRYKHIVHLSLLPLVPLVSSCKPQAEIWKELVLFFSGQNLNQAVTQWLPLWGCVFKKLPEHCMSQTETDKLVTYRSILNLFLCWMEQLLKDRTLSVTGEVSLFYTDTVEVCTGYYRGWSHHADESWDLRARATPGSTNRAESSALRFLSQCMMRWHPQGAFCSEF